MTVTRPRNDVSCSVKQAMALPMTPPPTMTTWKSRSSCIVRVRIINCAPGNDPHAHCVRCPRGGASAAWDGPAPLTCPPSALHPCRGGSRGARLRFARRRAAPRVRPRRERAGAGEPRGHAGGRPAAADAGVGWRRAGREDRHRVPAQPGTRPRERGGPLRADGRGHRASARAHRRRGADAAPHGRRVGARVRLPVAPGRAPAARRRHAVRSPRRWPRRTARCGRSSASTSGGGRRHARPRPRRGSSPAACPHGPSRISTARSRRRTSSPARPPRPSRSCTERRCGPGRTSTSWVRSRRACARATTRPCGARACSSTRSPARSRKRATSCSRSRPGRSSAVTCWPSSPTCARDAIPGAPRDDEITLFKSVGTALEDLCAARLVAQRCAGSR